MEHEPQHVSYRTYWISWGLLLVLTVIMLLAEELQLGAAVTLLVLLGAMVVKATVIGAWFMHLKYERVALVLSVALGILATGGALFFLLLPEALSVARLSQ